MLTAALLLGRKESFDPWVWFVKGRD